jgi:glycosyltransferase involved in cell wall biosynthesis
VRVGLDLSITAFNAAGNARYALCLEAALAAGGDLELVRFELPAALRASAAGARRKALVLYWEFVYAPALLPLLARRARVDLLHCPLPMPVGAPGCPLVVTALDAIPALFPHWFTQAMGLRLRRWLRRGVLAADALITISNRTADDLRRLFPGLSTPVYPVLLGSFLDAAAAGPAAAGPPYLLCVGTLEPRKNLARAIEAYALLARARPDLPRLVVVGGQGWGDVNLVQLAAQHGVADRVELAGFLSDADLGALYAGAELLIYPSLYEGFGFPVLEAMSMGCPVVTSCSSSLPEVGGAAALYADPADPAAIARAVARILDDAALAARLRADGLRRARMFTWQRCARETVAVYRRTLARCGGR